MSQEEKKTQRQLITEAAGPDLARWLAGKEDLFRTVWNHAAYTIPIPLEKQTLRVNDTIEFAISRSPKRYVVVLSTWVTLTQPSTGDQKPGALILFAALGGEPEIGRLSDIAGQSYIRVMRFDGPIFYGKKAKACYDAYAQKMKSMGLEEYILPFVSENKPPEEPPEEMPPSDTATPEKADVVLHHSVQRGSTATWDNAEDRKRPKDQSIYSVLRRFGYVWVPSEEVYRRTHSIGLVETRAPIHSIVEYLHRLGLKVYLDLGTGTVEEGIRRRKEYLTARSERFEARAAKTAQSAIQMRQAAGLRAEREVTRLELPGYFPTPPEVAREVVTHADLDDTMLILEPEAGHGALIRAVLEQYPKADIEAVEIQPKLRTMLDEQGVVLIGHDLMDPNFDPGTRYDRILMNPPFENGASLDHVQQAWRFLAPGGRLVAILPESILYREDKKHTAFREWYEKRGATVYDVERQEFGRAASIKTRILVVDRGMSCPSREANEQTEDAILKARAKARESEASMPEERSQNQSEKDWERQRALERAAGERRLSKAERLELRAIRETAKASYYERRAQGIRKEAGYTRAADVSKGGRTAEYKPTAPRASQTSSQYLQEVQEYMRKLKKPTRASELKRKYFGDASIEYKLTLVHPTKTIYGALTRLPLDLDITITVRLVGKNKFGVEADRYESVATVENVKIEITFLEHVHDEGRSGYKRTKADRLFPVGTEPKLLFDAIIEMINHHPTTEKFWEGA